ncbi:hypothetical protein [Streptomyces fuscichromogenes]|uniref:Uncharacterized protein n=1 Tax=Streptomyces fuscichromogenes TaxID=1324013 RepID=A0A917X911_9ACTN|nr:hypothetical protein [Streptomyces fuscichromogenes]GGM92637.1 hypothetical protein GCM10011578_010850 [Streptomyces fuscichromogenes]
MAHRRRLFLRLSLKTFTGAVPMTVTLCVISFVQDGLSWSTLRDTTGIPLASAALSPLWAAWRTRSLVRAARGLDIPVSENALDRTQTHILTGVPLPLVRAELGAARRASGVRGGNPVDFSWRPFRGRTYADGSVTYDETSGETRVEVHAGKRLGTDTPLFQGAVFLALCQIVRTLEGR